MHCGPLNITETENIPTNNLGKNINFLVKEEALSDLKLQILKKEI